MKLKVLVLTAVAVLLWTSRLEANWGFNIRIQNQDSEGNLLGSSMSMGEREEAEDGYDNQNDMSFTFPSLGSQYVICYFVHEDWGDDNGNYLTDIRSLQPANKIWNSCVRAQNPYTPQYTLSWQLTANIPPYYQPVLHFGENSIDMRAQSSYSYSSYAGYTYFSIELLYNEYLPYQTQELPDLLFSDNQERSFDLNEYFALSNGELSYGCLANPDLIQSLETSEDSALWHVYPRPGWIGQTSSTLYAYGPTGDSLSVEVSIMRDSTNSPPLYQGVSYLELTQNQSAIWNWSGQVFDADRDEVSLSFYPAEHITIQPVDSLGAVELIPEPAFKGETQITLQLDDGINPSILDTLRILVLPSVPQMPQFTAWQILSDGSLSLRWSMVQSDINNLPITGIRYRVLLSHDPAGIHLLDTFETPDSRIVLPLVYQRCFIRIIAINEI